MVPSVEAFAYIVAPPSQRRRPLFHDAAGQCCSNCVPGFEHTRYGCDGVQQMVMVRLGTARPRLSQPLVRRQERFDARLYTERKLTTVSQCSVVGEGQRTQN